MNFKTLIILSFLLFDSLFFIFLHIVFYRICHDFNLSILLTVLVFIVFLKYKQSNIYHFIIIILIFSLFILTVPAMNDRSGTVYMMKHINETQLISKNDLHNQMMIYYLNEGFTEKRIIEQKKAGNIEEYDGKLSLTSKGSILTNIYLFFELCYYN